MKSRSGLISSWGGNAVSVVVLVCVVAVISAACSEDGEGDPAATPVTPGTMTFELKGSIVGQSERALVVTVTNEDGAAISRACIGIGSDEFKVPPLVLTDMPSGRDPCARATDETVFPVGKYTVTAGIYRPPNSQAEKIQIRQVTTVEGESLVVSMRGEGLSE